MSTEGKNAKDEIREILIKVLETLCQIVFPGSNFKVDGSSFTIHTKTIDKEQLLAIAEAVQNNNELDLNLKRSGTSITILIKFKESDTKAVVARKATEES